jgi:hypothetical protein
LDVFRRLLERVPDSGIADYIPEYLTEESICGDLLVKVKAMAGDIESGVAEKAGGVAICRVDLAALALVVDAFLQWPPDLPAKVDEHSIRDLSGRLHGVFRDLDHLRRQACKNT